MRDIDTPEMPVEPTDPALVGAAYRVVVANAPAPADLLAALGLDR